MQSARRLALALVGVLPGCAPSTFGCTDDAQCLAGAEQGWCEAGGYCSFEDDACEGGRRYGEFAPSALAGSCVNPDESATSSSTSSSVPNTTTGTADPTLESMTDPASSTDPDADASSSEGGLESSTTDVVPTCDDWWDCAWNQRALVEVTPLAEGDLTSFPVPVRLVDAFAEAAPSVRFVSLDGSELPYERDGELVWVLVPDMPAEGLQFHAYFDNPDATAPEYAGLWDAYALVLHGETPDDATGENTPMLVTDVVSAPGQLGEALSFDGVGSIIVFPPDPSFADLRTDGFTITCWARMSSHAEHDNYPRLLDNADATEATTGWSFTLGPNGTAPSDRPRIDLGMSTQERRVTFPTVPLDTWVYLALTVAKEDADIWYDTTLHDGSVGQPGDGEVASDATNPLAIGASAYDTSRAYMGELDEVRLVRGVRSADWLRAEYEVAQPGAVTVGEPEANPN